MGGGEFYLLWVSWGGGVVNKLLDIRFRFHSAVEYGTEKKDSFTQKHIQFQQPTGPQPLCGRIVCDLECYHRGHPPLRSPKPCSSNLCRLSTPSLPISFRSLILYSVFPLVPSFPCPLSAFGRVQVFPALANLPLILISLFSCCPAKILSVHSREEFLILVEWFCPYVWLTLDLSKCNKLVFWDWTETVEGLIDVKTMALLSFYGK